MAPIFLSVVIALACWVPEAWGQTFFTNTGAYQQPVQQSAVMTMYMHDNLDTNPPSAVTVVRSPNIVNGASNPTLFGSIAVFDDSITMTPDPSSMELARGRGLYVFNSMEMGSTALEFVWTMEFGPNTGYAGSTVSFKGYDRISDADREIVITGGTGAFRMARGWAIISTVAANGGAAILALSVHIFYGV
ncbi:unnamed protein product [Calypogeia fissa]